MEFRILGPLEIRSDSGLKHDLAGKQRALLAVLLLHADEAVSTDRLIDALWGEHPPDTASKALQVYVSRLRKLLEPEGKGLLVTRPPGYALQLGAHELDLRRFERLRAEASTAAGDGDAATAEARLGEALSLWRGSPLADLALEPFAHTEIARLDELRLLAVEDRNEALLTLGRHTDVIAETEALIVDHPLRERLRAQLILALYRSRRQAEALEAYQAARRALVDELGIEPSPELQELERRILRQDPSLEPVPQAPATRPVPGRRAAGTFVGRTWELETLEAGLDDAFAGRGRLFLAVGEPGIGKSRLADEFASRAKQRGAGVLWGRCWEGEGASPYWVWVQALRSYIRSRAPDLVRTSVGAHGAKLAQLVPELAEVDPEVLDPENTRFELFEAVTAFLRTAATQETLVLVLDDLHAADEASLLMLRFVAGELAEIPIVVLGTYRDDIDCEPEADALAELRGLPARQLRLGGLAPAEVARFVEVATGVEPAKKLVEAVHAETEGNPLFVGEVVRMLAAEGRLTEAPGVDWRVQVPAGVHEATAQRLRALSKDCRRVLTIASALGREFSTEVLETVSDMSEDEVLDGLDEAFAARVLTEVPGAPERMRFARARTRDSVYNDLSTARRARLHLRIGEALEELYGADDQHVDELAHHFFLAGPGGDVEKTIDYSRRAGERAVGLLAYDEAVRHYEHALKASERRKGKDDREKDELLLALADARSHAGEPG